MSTEKVVCLLAVLMSTTFLAAVHCHRNRQNAILKLMIETENMKDEMRSIKQRHYDKEVFLSKTELIQSCLRKVKEYIQNLDPYYELNNEKFMAENNALASYPDQFRFHYALKPTPPMLYKSSMLEYLDERHRRFVDIIHAKVKNYDINYVIDTCKRGISRLRMRSMLINISKVCTSLNACATIARPYGRAHDEDVTKACTADQKCNAEEAVPMMTGMFYSKVYEMAMFHECCRLFSWSHRSRRTTKLRRISCNTYHRHSKDVIHEADVLLAYTYSQITFWTHLWNSFFNDAISNNAHVDIHVAVSVMEEKKKDFEILRVACQVLQFAEACVYDDIYKQYKIIKRIQQNRQNLTHIKDLRLHQQMDHAKIVKLHTIKSNQIEILGSVHALDENLQASVSGLSAFFGELANFDKGIADADAAFVSGELKKYTTALTEVEDKLWADLDEVMGYAVGVLTIAVIEKVSLLGMKIATNTNPLKLIFTSPDLADIASLTNDIANAAADFTKGIFLITSLTQLADDSETFAAAFIGNDEQLSTAESLKDQILHGQADNLNEDADKFLDQYSAYTPQTDRSSLAKNDALWSAFKDAACDLLSIDTGVLSSIPKGIAQGQLLCEHLDGTLAQFFTLREDIFDFQFQFIDALAGIVRGNLAQRLAENIRGNGDAVSGAQLLTTSFLAQSDLQTVASSYCDFIEYKQLGQSFTAGCSTLRGLFSKENLGMLIAYTASTATHHEVERFVTIPTQPSYPGDMAYIDLQSLANGREVVFKIPKNTTWLADHRWTVPGQDRTQVPFVKTFEVYLPHKSYESGAIPGESTMEIAINSIAGSFVSTLNPNTGTAYLLPRGSGTYLTSYEENYSSCSIEINNPYSLCENLPKLCMLSSRYPGEDALLPTILSTWSIRLRRTQGSRKLIWEAPHPSTHLLVTAKVVLQAPSLTQRKQSHSSKHLARSDVVESENGCCEGNRYRLSRRNQECKSCPAGSTSLLRGLYCEIDQPLQAHTNINHGLHKNNITH